MRARDRFFGLAVSLVLALAASAGSAASAQVRMAKIAAHPALWTITSKTATIYLLGSIHLLPENVVWRTPAIDAAMARANVFVFEAPIDDAGKAAVAEFVRKNGSLPAGTTLRSLLSKSTLAEYTRALAAAHLQPEMLDHDRPWLAAITLDVAYLQHMRYVIADGVDQQIFADAHAHGKQIEYFETPEQQLALFMPKDQKLELDEFAADLKSFRSEQETIGAMIDAWGAGEVGTVGRLMNKDLDAVPGAKKLLIDDRNRAWTKKLDQMLLRREIFFVTVGAGHLAGPKGVPALLRAQGISVDGP